MHENAPRLIGLFYEAATTPALWSEALAAFADAVHASDAHIIALEKGTGRPILAIASPRGILREFLPPYFRFWAARDPLIPKMLVAPKERGTLMLSQEYLSRREVTESDYFQEFAIPGGVRHQAAWVLEDGPQLHAVVDFVRDGTPFERDQLSPWHIVAQHLQHALRLGLQLAEADTQIMRWRQAADQAHLVCLIVDGSGRLLDQSAAATTLLNRGGALRVHGGRLMASTPEDTQLLHRNIALAAKGRGGGELRLACNVDALELQIVPAGVRADNPFSRRYADCALILIPQRTRHRAPTAVAIRARLHCTLAEAGVAAALAAGHSPQEIADLRHVSIHTIRTQLRALFACTGTRRIGELVALIAGL